MRILKSALLFLFLIGLFAGLYYIFSPEKKEEILPENRAEEALQTIPLESAGGVPEAPALEVKEETEAIPEELLMAVPFTPQAPTANWDELHDEACEEASAIIAKAFFENDSRVLLPPTEVESEIKKLTKWQKEKLGYSLSIDTEETARMIQEVYGLHTEVLREFSEDSLKKILSEEKLILLPANGQALGNPYFRPPGPIYHMLVLTGYTKDSFVVNDPGTKRGKGYQYTYKTLRSAVGDYNHKKKETDPRKPVILIVSK